jgi:DNA-directed RNA polymerase subunit F
MMTSYGQTVTQQGQPLTVSEAKKLLRESLDREKVLVKQRDAALQHIDSLEKEIQTRTTASAVDAAAIKNLQDQKAAFTVEVNELRAALENQKVATASLRTALERAEQEVTRQKEKVKAANRRTWWGIIGGIAAGAIAVVALQRK